MSGAVVMGTALGMYGRVTYAGRPDGQLGGSHVADLVSLGKGVTLCQIGCERKFDAKRNNYEKARGAFARGVTAQCDGCRSSPYQPCTLFVRCDTVNF